jgi:hypothetical protein
MLFLFLQTLKDFVGGKNKIGFVDEEADELPYKCRLHVKELDARDGRPVPEFWYF